LVSDTHSSTTESFAPLRLILMGTGPFAVPSFEAIRASKVGTSAHSILAVVTRPLPPVKSRSGPPPSPVRSWAQSHGLPILDPLSINTEDAIAELRALKPDLLVVCDYGQILKPAALEVARLGGINLHGSLLPKYRGAAPVQWAMLRGDAVTGVSVIHMTPRLDGGPVLTKRSTPIRDDETAGELESRLAELGVDATLQGIAQVANWDGDSPIGEVQDPAEATKAPRLQKSDGEIDWSRTAREIDCHVRGMQPWPVAFTHLPISAGKPPVRLAVKRIRTLDQSAGQRSPGQVVVSPPDGPRGLVVATADQLVEIVLLQPSGKREMSGEEFLRGHKLGDGVCCVRK
jgi:methionyl-tRNA formyltransferase